MPIINCDAKALEFYAAAWYYNDEVMLQECRDNVDMHTDNQKRFSLPTRDSAKPVGFLILYGGTEYSLAADPKLKTVSTSADYWKNIIELWYNKYKGIRAGHRRDTRAVVWSGGKLLMPYGREYFFKQYKNQRTGELEWPVTQIKNYPVQGSGATFMALVRCEIHKQIRDAGLSAKLILTVHDSIVVDAPHKEVDKVVEIMYAAFDSLPGLIRSVLKVEFSIPMRCEVQVGVNYADMFEIKRGVAYKWQK